jgi:hypothetical protein
MCEAAMSLLPEPIQLLCSAQAYLCWELGWARRLLNTRWEHGEGMGGEGVGVPRTREAARRQRQRLHIREWVGFEWLSQRFGLSAWEEVGLMLFAAVDLVPESIQRRPNGEPGRLSLRELEGLIGARARAVTLRLMSLGWLEVEEADADGGLRVLGDVVSLLAGVNAVDQRLRRVAWLQPTALPVGAGDGLEEVEAVEQRVILTYSNPAIEQLAARWIAEQQGKSWVLTVMCDGLEDAASVMPTLDLAHRSACFHGASLHLSGLSELLQQHPSLAEVISGWVEDNKSALILGVTEGEAQPWSGRRMGDDDADDALSATVGMLHAELPLGAGAVNQDQEPVSG